MGLFDGKFVTYSGTTSQYIRGDGSIAEFPSVGGGGGVVFYLNGGVTTDVVGYFEMSSTANTGPAANFSLTGDGLICSFLTPVGSPNLTTVPAGNNIVNVYAAMSSSGGSPQLYVELYKYDGVTFTLLATSVAETIDNGTQMDLYTMALGIPELTIAPTDRFALKFYAQNVGGQTMTIFTQDSHLSEVISTVPSGIVSINGLTSFTQTFATGTSGTNFNISSSGSTHTFNIPTASSVNTGLLSSSNWTTFNNKLSKGTKTIFCIDNGNYANGQAAIDAASARDTILFGAKSGGWGDLVIPAGKTLSLKGLVTENSTQIVQIGSITFSPTTGLNINDNELYLDSLYIQSNTSTVITFGGTAPARIRLNNCYIYTSGASNQICVFTNSNAQSSWYITECTLNSTNSQIMIQSSVNYGRLHYSEAECNGIVFQNDSGTSEIRECVLESTSSGSVVSILAGSVLSGYSQFTNTGANSSGIAVSTGAVFASSYNSFSVPTGTGYCIRGTGIHVYGQMVFANSALAAYNVKVQNTLTNVPFTTAFTLSP